MLTVVDSLRRGGAERLLVSLQGRLSRRHFELRVASLMEPSHLAEELRAMKVTVHELGLAGPSDLLRGVLKVRRLVSAMGIDLVHTYRPFAGMVGRLAALGRVPVVSTLADPEEPGDDPPWDKGVLAALDRFTARRLARRLLVSSGTSQERHAQRGIPGSEVLSCALDIESLLSRLEQHDRATARRALGLGSEETVYLHVGRFLPSRGQNLLLRAFRVALTEEPELRLLLAGEGPALAGARVLAEELDLQDAVVFLGDVEDVAQLYSAADVFTLPARPAVFSTALLEAMAAGLPAVVYERGDDVPEVATEDTAVFADARRGEAFARGMLALGREPDMRSRMDEGAHRRAAAFDVSVCLPKLESIYQELA